METTPVTIVGAGPSGLALGLALARYEIKSIILEKEHAVTEDPRGVILPQDAVRIFWDLGIREELWTTIGHEIPLINFHKTNIQNEPFFTDKINEDALSQGLPDGVLMMQPKLEQRLRDLVQQSQFCEIRCDSEVISISEISNGMLVEHKQPNSDKLEQLRSSFLIGADGKRGIVRKQYLEPIAGIKQETGLFAYEGTWIAANLHINLPTQESHPDFALWQLGYSPEQVYDLFWPTGWHFCSPPGKPTACGRFGPYSARLWRQEYAELDWDDSMDPTARFWQNVLPMLVRSKDGDKTFSEPVSFPKDCIEIMRCAPYHFAQKVVNKWFHNRTVLIGDAAHVFPPFGGQGIASGIRDAAGLAWRLALLLQQPDINTSQSERLLTSWSHERRQGIDDATRFTLRNGSLTNQGETWDFALHKFMAAAVSHFPFRAEKVDEMVSVEEQGYKPTKDGFFLSHQAGGGKLAQIHLSSGEGRRCFSDEILKHGKTVMTLLVIGDDSGIETQRVERLVKAIGLHHSVLTEQSIINLSVTDACGNAKVGNRNSYKPMTRLEVTDVKTGLRYDEKVYTERLGAQAKYVIVRPDFIVFAVARNLSELEGCLDSLQACLEG